MFGFIKKFFDFNQKELERIRKKVEEINNLEEQQRKLVDADFPKETKKLKKLLVEGKSLDGILPQAFSLVREGKTLVATLPLYLNALTGKGVHLVTVNDYLARRDAGWMGKLFNFLGMTTSAIISDKSYIFDASYSSEENKDWRLTHLKDCSRKEAYLADVTYGINSEFGFDYLRDNMAQNPEELVQRNFNFAIIDEADSVLIDEARTPHIISAPNKDDISKYYRYAQIAKTLNSKDDYIVDEKSRTANMTEVGIKKIEANLGVDNIYEKDFEALFHIEAALKAEALFKNNKDYIVRNNEVIIVDEFTGRLLEGRRFSEGIHQAIEAKENVSIQKESKTLATVSLQNYFRMYKKLAGMTGTAATEAEEFNKIYKADVLIIPTHSPMVRKDGADMIYKTEKAKFEAVVEEIVREYQKGRPVLVGTTSIDKNELLSSLLHKRNIPHELLNAKNHEKEAEIIAGAGKKMAITVATNMAGRGVDIILGGTKESQSSNVKSQNKWQTEHDEVVSLGGLYIIGTERHESRRIDNQLRGRAGRQGDPGETRFFVSLEDDLMRIFGGEQISKLMTMFNFPEDQALTHPMVSKAIEQAQVKVEGFNFDIRKHLVDFDDVLNRQREIIYTLRRKILNAKENFKDVVFEIIKEEIEETVNQYFVDENVFFDEEEINRIIKEIDLVVTVSESQMRELIKKKETIKLINFLVENTKNEFEKRERKIGVENWQGIVKMIILSTIDTFWTQHLTAIEDLREGINLRGYAQLDPLVEYKNEAFIMFEKLVREINFESTRRLFKVEMEGPAFAKASAGEEKKNKPMIFKSASGIDTFNQASQQSVKSNEQMPANPIRSTNKIGRNDPCYCGSGKKYKKCHYPN